MAVELISGFARELVGAGICDGLFSTSLLHQTVAQTNFRREPVQSSQTIVLLSQTGGIAFPLDKKEQYAFQVLVDSYQHRKAQDVARQVFDHWHDKVAYTTSGNFNIQWVRAVAPPQALPGPTDQRYTFSVNFDALWVKE